MERRSECESMSRREFLGYCAATAGSITSARLSWAAQSDAGDVASTTRGLEALNDALEGVLLLPEDQRFELTSTTSWNQLLPQRRPALIVVAASPSDAVHAINFAREHRFKVAVRGGGHNWCSSSLRQGGVLLDLSRLRSVEIDAQAATATIGPAIQGAELVQRTAEHGLAFPVAHCPTVSMSGFLLNGGNGLNFNRWGSACSNVLAIDLVLADGSELTVSEDEHADLFWAARGAGPGFFAVATRYRLKLHPLPRGITMSTYVFPESAIGEASELLDRVAGQLSRDLLVALSIGAPTPELAADNETVGIIFAVAYCDSHSEAEEALRPLHSDVGMQRAISSSVNVPADLHAVLGAFAPTLPGGHRCLVDNVWSNRALDTIVEGSSEHYAKAPSPKSHLLAVLFHPDYELKGTSHSLHGRYLVYNNTLWDDAADDDSNRAWHVEATGLIDPHKIGRYLGETDLNKEAGVAEQGFTPESWKRLRALRNVYDPGAVFYDYLGMA
ncbi:MAG: FAD-binding oxidoreductase [Myxococcales bacterium]|nr:FAD-binding oxidoreductase [Myxococcales bacterium]